MLLGYCNPALKANWVTVILPHDIVVLLHDTVILLHDTVILSHDNILLFTCNMLNLYILHNISRELMLIPRGILEVHYCVNDCVTHTSQ